jgi:hypothetical protein
MQGDCNFSVGLGSAARERPAKLKPGALPPSNLPRIDLELFGNLRISIAK